MLSEMGKEMGKGITGLIMWTCPAGRRHRPITSAGHWGLYRGACIVALVFMLLMDCSRAVKGH